MEQFGFDSGLASGLSRETGRRATVSGKAASRCNPAVPVSNYPQLRNYQVKTGVKHN